MVKDIKAAIEAVLQDEDMPEHMVTKKDDAQMRALLEKHLLPRVVHVLRYSGTIEPTTLTLEEAAGIASQNPRVHLFVMES